MLNLIPKEQPLQFRQALLEIVNELDERLYERISDLLQEFDLSTTLIEPLSALISGFTYGGSLLVEEPVLERLEAFNKEVESLYDKTV